MGKKDLRKNNHTIWCESAICDDCDAFSITSTGNSILLSEALTLAAGVHAGQIDGNNEPYILHALRVMLSGTNNDERICGLLHDVLTDSDLTINDLQQHGFSKNVINALDCLVQRENESDTSCLNRIKLNPLARRVKILDLNDTLRFTQIELLSRCQIKKNENMLKILLNKEKEE